MIDLERLNFKGLVYYLWSLMHNYLGDKTLAIKVKAYEY